MRWLTKPYFSAGSRSCSKSLMCRPAFQRVAKQLNRAALHSSATKGEKLFARAVRPVPLKVISVSKSNSPGAEMMAGEWLEKLQRYTRASELVIRPNPKKASEPEVAVQAEGERILKALSQQDMLVVLDERGKEATSQSLADLVAKAGDEGRPCIAFCIGGPHGHSSEVRSRADVVLRLSGCVLNHQVARIVLLEQLYRAWTILRGEPYHH